MITFKSVTDLNQLAPEHPARPVVARVFYQLIDACTWKGRAYRPTDDGYVVLIEEGDIDKVIDLPELQCPLADVPWEGAVKREGYFHAVYLTNNQFGIGFLIPDSVQGKLREVLVDLL